MSLIGAQNELISSAAAGVGVRRSMVASFNLGIRDGSPGMSSTGGEEETLSCA